MPLVTRTVEITPEDIAKGKPKNCCFCPGALAIGRTFPEAKYVEVMDLEVRLSFPHKTRPTFPSQTHEAPGSLHAFIQAFDNNKEVQPISFDLTFNVEPTKCSFPLLS